METQDRLARENFTIFLWEGRTSRFSASRMTEKDGKLGFPPNADAIFPLRPLAFGMFRPYPSL